MGLRLERIFRCHEQYQEQCEKNITWTIFPILRRIISSPENHKLGITYNKHDINRPGYGMLNPFMFFLDKYTFFRGNSYLTPEYIHNTELTYTFKNKCLTPSSPSATAA